MKYKRMPNLSDRLKYVRSFYGLSQEDLGKMVGTTQQAIQQAEMGKARQPRYLHTIARELDIPVDWMVFGEAVKKGQETSKTSKVSKGKKKGHVLNDRAIDILDSFYAMPKKDQNLLYELMKSRKKK